MKKHLFTASLLMTSLITSLALSGVVLGDDDEREERRSNSGQTDVAPVTSDLYKRECGGCHFAYQPGLLPERSWRKMMGGAGGPLRRQRRTGSGGSPADPRLSGGPCRRPVRPQALTQDRPLDWQGRGAAAH